MLGADHAQRVHLRPTVRHRMPADGEANHEMREHVVNSEPRITARDVRSRRGVREHNARDSAGEMREENTPKYDDGSMCNTAALWLLPASPLTIMENLVDVRLA